MAFSMMPVTLGAANLPQLFGIADKDVDGVDIAGAGLVRLKANNVYVTPNSFYNPGPVSPAIVDTTSPSIQRAVNVASSGDTVNIGSGPIYSDKYRTPRRTSRLTCSAKARWAL